MGSREDVQALARAFARQFEHLREFRGVHYVGAGPMESGHLDSQPPTVAEVPIVVPSLRPPADAKPDLRNQPAAAKLAYLRERNIGDCQRCGLAKTRTNIVFGVGNPEAELMFVGEAPGGDEDRQGEPFVGAAGKRLDQWLRQLGLAREQVYIANVLKCRPPGNRDPLPDEVQRCSPFLHAQIRAIRPRVLIGLGGFAGKLLLGRDTSVGAMRGQVHEYHQPNSDVRVPAVVTYHPSYVLRREAEAGRERRPDAGASIKSEEQKVLDDLRRALSLVQRT